MGGVDRDLDARTLAARAKIYIAEGGDSLNSRLRVIQSAIWTCTRCHGDAQVETKIRQQTCLLPDDAKLLIVATAPPYQRDVVEKVKAASVHTDGSDRLRAFLARTLQSDWTALMESGVAVLHAVKCAIVPKSREEDERQHKNPPRRVVTRCARPHFAEEFREVKAPVVVTLGTAALHAVRIACANSAPSFLGLPLNEFTDEDVFTITFGDRTFELVVSTHPFANRERALRDVRRAAMLAGILTEEV